MSSAHPHTPKEVSDSAGASDKVAMEGLEQLRKENSELRATLASSREENALLNDVISTIGSTLKLDEVLRHLVDTIVRAISCHAAFIYLYNKEKDRLILASTSEQYLEQVGKIELAPGEGITGWVALHKSVVALASNASADSRFIARWPSTPKPAISA